MSSSFLGMGFRILVAAALWLQAGAAAAQQASATVDADKVQHIAIVGGSYFFRPAQIVARANQPLEIVLSVEPGLAPGSYPFYCANRLLWFESHREHGMAGVLQVPE